MSQARAQKRNSFFFWCVCVCVCVCYSSIGPTCARVCVICNGTSWLSDGWHEWLDRWTDYIYRGRGGVVLAPYINVITLSLCLFAKQNTLE